MRVQYDRTTQSGLDDYYLDQSINFQGGIYFVQGVDGGPIKIGFSRYEPTKRLRQLQSHSPVKLHVIGWVAGMGTTLERDLHAKFSNDRLHGEWFSSSARLISWIAEHGEYPPRPYKRKPSGAFVGGGWDYK